MPKPNPELTDEVSPELDEDFFARARPGAEVLPRLLGEEVAGQLLRRRGPQKAPTKALVSLRLDQDVIDHFRSGGDGWQSRMNAALREAARLAPVKTPAR